jgi:hypothetical protein
MKLIDLKKELNIDIETLKYRVFLVKLTDRVIINVMN